jgi:caffeoyl-CoA O-methyltransferase
VKGAFGSVNFFAYYNIMIIKNKLAEYTESFTTPEPEIVQRLVRDSEQNLDYTDMISGRQAGMLLRLLVRLSGAKRVLEIGTFTGYSAMMMADVMDKNSELITIDVNLRYKNISARYFSVPPYHEIIRQISGNALDILPEMEGLFDLIYLDADKVNYPEYFRIVKSKLKTDGILVADNTLWGGEVICPETDKAKAVHFFNELLRDDPAFEQVMLPVRDGITIARYSGVSEL